MGCFGQLLPLFIWQAGQSCLAWCGTGVFRRRAGFLNSSDATLEWGGSSHGALGYWCLFFPFISLLTPAVDHAQGFKVRKLTEQCVWVILHTLTSHVNENPEQKPSFPLLQV